MRNIFSEALYECAKNDPKIVIIVADISPAGSMLKFRNEFPDRFINVGVAEQIMVGMAAGLAISGFKPFVYTIATFALYRPFEMVRDDLAYQNLPVTVVGMGSGVVYSTLGGTHHAMEDVAIAGAIPNMQVLSPCDPLEVIECTKYCAKQNKGPVYLRLAKSGEPVLTDKAITSFSFGKVHVISKGTDICILSHGAITGLANKIAKKLQEKYSVTLASCHTLKPLDKEGIKELLLHHKEIIVIEEHVEHGGLSSMVKQIAWDSNAKCTLKTYFLKDEFIHCYGSHEELLSKHGLTEEHILKSITSGGAS